MLGGGFRFDSAWRGFRLYVRGDDWIILMNRDDPCLTVTSSMLEVSVEVRVASRTDYYLCVAASRSVQDMLALSWAAGEKSENAGE